MGEGYLGHRVVCCRRGVRDCHQDQHRCRQINIPAFSTACSSSSPCSKQAGLPGHFCDLHYLSTNTASTYSLNSAFTPSHLGRGGRSSTHGDIDWYNIYSDLKFRIFHSSSCIWLNLELAVCILLDVCENNVIFNHLFDYIIVDQRLKIFVVGWPLAILTI